MVENGIKPAYVFDGKPPDLKSGVVSVASISRILFHPYPWHSFQNASRRGKRLRRRERKPKKQVRDSYVVLMIVARTG